MGILGVWNKSFLSLIHIIIRANAMMDIKKYLKSRYPKSDSDNVVPTLNKTMK